MPEGTGEMSFVICDEMCIILGTSNQRSRLVLYIYIHTYIYIYIYSHLHLLYMSFLGPLQVREPRKETEKYGGEISGIKIGVVKSIKLK